MIRLDITLTEIAVDDIYTTLKLKRAEYVTNMEAALANGSSKVRASVWQRKIESIDTMLDYIQARRQQGGEI